MPKLKNLVKTDKCLIYRGAFIRQQISSVSKNISKLNASLDAQIEVISANFGNYIKENTTVIVMLALIAVIAYGFELFNFNITIDEELSLNPLVWIAQGRPGMYLLNKLLLPDPVIPFVSLFLGLIFQIGAILLLLKSWNVKSKVEQTIIGAVYLTFPGLSYMYVFSIAAYGVGIGFYCVALSLFLYTQCVGLPKYISIIPATFAISIYQGFILPLVLAFLVYLISFGIHTGKRTFYHVIRICIILMLSILAYIIIQQLFLMISDLTLSKYITGWFTGTNLLDNFGFLLLAYWNILSKVYLGDPSIYSYSIEMLGVLIAISFLGLAASLLRSKSTVIVKVFVFLFTLALFFLPFASGFIMNGQYDMRFLLGLPVVISGLTMLGMGDNPRIYKLLVGLLAIVCVFSFVKSDNHLFASSHIALQVDRSVATRLIERIEEAKTDAELLDNKQVKYMEMIGYLSFPETALMPKRSVFGASFFEWDQGNVNRVLLFLQTLGYHGLQALPIERRSTMVELSITMPSWPAKGSVRVVGDTVLVKFGPYSDAQKRYMGVNP